MKLHQSEFVRNVLTLLTGTTIAQAFPLAISPILTRIYTPEDFGVLAIYLTLVSIFGVIATARYELAIVQPVEKADAAAIVVLSILIAVALSLITLAMVSFFNAEISELLGSNEIGIWLYFLPVSIFITGVYQALNYWCVRQKNYKLVALSNISQAATGPSVQAIFGYLKLTGGLILGGVVGALASFCVLLRSVIKRDGDIFRKVTLEKVKLNAARYSQFPKFSLGGALANSAGQQMPVFFIIRLFDASILGFYSVIMRVVNVPVILLSGGLSQVVYQRVSYMQNNSPQEIKFFIVKLFVVLALATIPFIAVIYFFGDELFAFIFGEPWRMAGELSGIVVFAIAIRFAVSPLSVVLSLKGNIRLGATWQLIYLFTVVVTLYMLSSFEIRTFLIGFVIHDLVLYSLFMLFILKGATYQAPSEEQCS